jgi:hypothetical protein
LNACFRITVERFVAVTAFIALSVPTCSKELLEATMLSTVAEIIRDLLIFVGVIAALLIALIVVVSKLPDTNPLKRLLTALCYRLGATLAAGAIAIPLEPIPGIDIAYDVAVPVALIWYWFTFFRGAYSTMSHIPSQKAVTYRQSK